MMWRQVPPEVILSGEVTHFAAFFVFLSALSVIVWSFCINFV